MKLFAYHHIKIDKRSSLAISFQLAQSIKTMMLNHEIVYKDELPPIIEVSHELKIRKTDVEQAYMMLVEEKFVSKMDSKFIINYFHFSGNFFLDVVPLFEAIRQMGMTPSAKTISMKQVHIPFDMYISPNIDVDDQYLCFKRLYLGNEIPLIILEMYLPMSRFKDLDFNLSDDEGLYEYIAKSCGIKVCSSERKFKVINIDKENAKILNMLPQTASYQALAITYDQDHHIVDITRSWSIINYFFEMEFNKEDIEKIIQNHLFFI